MAIDWRLYEEDILRLYVNEDKTAKQTLQFLHDQYGITATPKQFKSKFGGLKNLTVDEWKFVIKEIRKRQNEGKESEVYFKGRKMRPKRLQEGIRRYSRQLSTGVLGMRGIPKGLELPDRERVKIRTPSPSIIQLPLPNDPVSVCTIIENTESLQGRTEAPEASLIQNEYFLAESFDDDLMGIETIPRVDNQVIRFKSPEYQYLFHHDSQLDPFSTRTPASPFPTMPDMFYTSPGAAFSPLILYNPFGFEYIPEILSLIPATRSSDNSLAELEIILSESAQRHNTYQEDIRLFQAHLSGIDPRLEYLKPATCILQNLFARMPRVSDISDPRVFATLEDLDQRTFHQIFSIMIYLGSNNTVDGCKMLPIFKFALDKGLMRSTSHISKIKRPVLRAFLENIMDTLSTTCTKGNALKVQNILEHILPVYGQRLPARLAGELLCALAGTSNEDAVKLLLDHGADINFVSDVEHDARYGFALGQALSKRQFSMARYLVDSGYDINQKLHGTTLLAQQIKRRNLKSANFLLDLGATIDDHSILLLAEQNLRELTPRLKELLTGRIPQVFRLVEAAENGNGTLSKFLFDNSIVQQEILEHALCHAIKTENLGAVITLLYRGVNPDVRNLLHARSTSGEENHEDDLPVLLAVENDSPSVFYMLVRAGATVADDNIVKICRIAVDRSRIEYFYILARAGHNITLFGPSALELIPAIITRNQGSELHNVGYLIDAGTPIDSYGINGYSGLQKAAQEGEFLLCQYLVARGANVNLPASDSRGRTALQAAAGCGHFELVDYLLEAGAKVDAAPAKKDGVTVLEAIASSWLRHESDKWQDTVRTFMRLLALGAQVNRSDSSNNILIHRLIRTGNIVCFKVAIQAGARTDDREHIQWAGIRSQSHIYIDTRGERTPLQVAASEGRGEMIQILLEHGAKINAPAGDEFGRTALQAATSAKHPDPSIVEFLHSRGADVSAPPAQKGGITAFQGAAISGNLQIAKMLLAWGADVNEAPAAEEGRTAIEGAAEHGRYDMVQFLLGLGAHGDPVSGFSRAIELAEKNHRYAIADVLREHERNNAPNVLFAGLDDPIFEVPGF